MLHLGEVKTRVPRQAAPAEYRIQNTTCFILDLQQIYNIDPNLLLWRKGEMVAFMIGFVFIWTNKQALPTQSSMNFEAHAVHCF